MSQNYPPIWFQTQKHFSNHHPEKNIISKNLILEDRRTQNRTNSMYPTSASKEISELDPLKGRQGGLDVWEDPKESEKEHVEESHLQEPLHSKQPFKEKSIF